MGRHGAVRALLGALSLLAVAAVGWPAPAAPTAPTAPARRIVSLNPSLTAILVRLGAAGQLVGVDDFSARRQPELTQLPTVGGLYNPSLEALVALDPDLVVLVPSAEQRAFRERARELGLSLLELDPLSFEDVLDTIAVLGERVGRQAAARARIADIRQARAEVEAASAASDPVPTVVVLQRDPTFVVGRGSFIDDMLRSAGGRNLAADLEGQGGPYPRVTREWLIAARPEVLLDASHDPEPAERYWARWSSIPAVEAGRVVSLPEGLATLPGPDLDVALRVLERALHADSAAPAETP